MSKTRQELVHQALRELGVLAEGQPVSAEDYSSVNRHVDGLLDELRDRDVVFVADVELTEERFFLPLAMVLADRSKSVFGRSGDPALRADAERAEGLLYAMTQDGPDFSIQEGQYF